jgi:hypothetical protein
VFQTHEQDGIGPNHDLPSGLLIRSSAGNTPVRRSIRLPCWTRISSLSPVRKLPMSPCDNR